MQTRQIRPAAAIAALLAASACADDAGTAAFGDSLDGAGTAAPGTTGDSFGGITATTSPGETGSTSGRATDTGVADTGGSGIADTGTSGTTTGEASGTDTGAGSSTGAATGSSTGADPVCGDGTADMGEACDGLDLSGSDCTLQGFDGGDLTCDADCAFDTSACTFNPVCGDDVTNGGDLCDGADLDGQTCGTQGFDGGVLACTPDCSAYDTSACTLDAVCGDNVTGGAEVCDGTDLNLEDCILQGFDGGTLGCTVGCDGYDTSACTSFVCGDDLTEGAEVCDGNDVNGQDCVSQGFDSGALGCAAGCGSYDTSACVLCGDNAIEGPEFCDGNDVNGQNCVLQGFDGGLLTCSADCGSYDTSACLVCGDNIIEGPEFCDGTDLSGQTCVSQGFDSGTLGCAGDCFSYDTSACLQCGDNNATGAEACDGADLNGQDCVSQGFASGSLTCAADCGSFVTTACVVGTCEDEDIGSATGVAVATGSLVGADNDLPQSCAGGDGVDHVVAFTATDAGNYTFDLEGSDYDTALAIFASCNVGSELACDDDGGTGLLSSITLGLSAGEQVFLAIGGFSGATGNYSLNIAAPGGAGVCVEQDLLSAVGAPTIAGTTVGEDDDLPQTCASGGGNDVVHLWAAPATANFTFDTEGSDYDTSLTLFTIDCGTELDCDDDGGTNFLSSLSRNMLLGEEILIVVSGFGVDEGNYDLNITQN